MALNQQESVVPEKVTFKGGLDLKFFAQAEFESLGNSVPTEHNAIMVRNALRLLIMGWPASWRQLISLTNLKAIFVKRDPELLKEFRLAFQQGFEHIFKQLEGQHLNSEQKEQVQLYLSNCLSLLPYSDLTPYESIKIPQCIDDTWELVEYFVSPIELTKNPKARDHDRVFAYGLEPLIQEKARSHLIFMGTTYPAGQGFVPQVKTDFEAFGTVGASLYLSGRAKTQEWLLRQTSKVYVCGVSLGGSLSLQLAIDFGDLLFRVDALNPAGLYDYHKNPYDRWDEIRYKPKVVVQQQGNDPVSLFGVWKADWDLLQIVPPEEKRGPVFFLDHIMNYAGFAETEFSYMSPEDENSKRKTRNLLLYTFARSAIYYFTIIPVTYLLRPALYFIIDHIALTVPLLFAALGSALLMGLGVAGLISSLFLISSLAVVVLTSSVFFIPAVIAAMVQSKDNGTEQDKDYADLHDPNLPRNPEMDIYNTENKINIDLTYKELNTYYKAMRCVLKHKEFLPEDEPQEKTVNYVSKRELLIASQEPENADSLVTLRKTKAKAMHIKHTLRFIERLSIKNEEELRNGLDRDYKHYSLGKH